MTVVRKYQVLRGILLVLQVLSAIFMAVLILLGLLVAVTPPVDFYYEGIVIQSQQSFVGVGVGLGAFGVVQFLAIWLVGSVISLMIERERNDRITHALLQRLIRTVEKEKQG